MSDPIQGELNLWPCAQQRAKITRFHVDQDIKIHWLSPMDPCTQNRDQRTDPLLTFKESIWHISIEAVVVAADASSLHIFLNNLTTVFRFYNLDLFGIYMPGHEMSEIHGRKWRYCRPGHTIWTGDPADKAPCVSFSGPSHLKTPCSNPTWNKNCFENVFV